MHSANRGASRAEFLRGASAAILRFASADSLDLWLEDGKLFYHWQTVAKPDLDNNNATFPTASVGERLFPQDPDFPEESLLKRVFSLIHDGEETPPGVDHCGYDGVWLGDSFVMPLVIDAHNEGVLRLTNPDLDATNPTQVEIYEDMAQLLGVAISNRRAKAALLERVKELTCMYRIAHIAAETNVSLDDMLQEIVELIPAALQYPDIATARITLGERSFSTTESGVGLHRLSADIFVSGEKSGEIEVFYSQTPDKTLDDRQLPMEDAFLTEEQHLIDGVARELNSIIESKHAEEEKLQLQEQVRHANRLVTIGELAAGVAHELNEPLGNILGFAQLAMKSPELTGQARTDVEKIEKASLYAREIIRKLMFFSRQTPSGQFDVNINNVVKDSLLLFESRCDTAGIEVVQKMGSLSSMIHGDPSQLQQVLVNLVVNAIQSMPTGGRLTISTMQKADKQFMIVQDTGSGIAPDDLERVFLPFFTTKEVGEGTGLGLSVVHGIVKSHGGSVNVESEIDSGSRFEIQLPVPTAAVSEVYDDDQ